MGEKLAAAAIIVGMAVWAVSTVASIFVKGYTPPAGLDAIMGAIVAAAVGWRGAERVRRKNGNGNGDSDRGKGA